MRILRILSVLCLSILPLQCAGARPAEGANMDGKVRVRYMETNIAPSVSFYTRYLGFKEQPGATANFVMLSRGNLELI